MELSKSQPSQDVSASNEEISTPVSTPNTATQIFLIKEELPYTRQSKKSSLTGFIDEKEQPQIIKISAESASRNVALIEKNTPTVSITHQSPNQATHAIVIERSSSNKTKQVKEKAKDSKMKSKDSKYTCDKCQKSYIHEASLKAHVRRTYCQETKSLVRA